MDILTATSVKWSAQTWARPDTRSSGSIGSISFERPPPPPLIPTLPDRPEYGRPRTLATRCYRTIGMCARLERRGGVRNSPSIWLCRATCQTPLLGAGLSQGTVSPTVGKPGPGDIHNRPSVQSPAVATQHLRPAGLGHVNPTTASAWPVLPALSCGEQSKHHVTRTSEARPRDWWAERAFAPGTNPTLSCALGPRSTLWVAGHGVAWLGAAIDSRRVSPPARFSLAVNAERHAIQ